MLDDYIPRWKSSTNEPRLFSGSISRGRMNRQEGIHPAVFIAAALDPRMKTAKYWMPREDDRTALYGNILSLMMDESNQSRASTVDIEDTAGNLDIGTSKSFIDLLFANDKGDENIIMANPNLTCERELEDFKNYPAAGRSEDPLVWWSTHESQFPTLARLAIKFLAIPATSAPSERIFSVAQRVVGKLKGRMHPTTAGTLIFLNSNKHKGL